MVVLYFITASFLLLFGNGFRLQISPLKLTRTGNLLITFVPKQATVFLDDVRVDTSSPSRIRAVFPGTHAVRIEAPGFFPYLHSVHVESMRTTFISDVYLIENHGATSSNTQTPTLTMQPEGATSASVAGSLLMVSSTQNGGTIISKDGDALTRDLGFGTWRIAGGDTHYFALTHIEKNEIEFRLWSTPDVVAFHISGTRMNTQTWNNGVEISTALVYSPFELWAINTARGSAAMVSRVSKPILRVLPIPQTAVVLAVLPNEIIAYQLADTMNTPISIVHVAPNEEIVDANLSMEGSSINFVTKKGGAFTAWSQVLFTK
jgi:hypothetical protein